MVALADACAEADYPAEIVGVISDRATAAGLEKAAVRGIPTAAFERRDYADKAAHEAAILDHVETLRPDLLCLAGYMRLLTGTFIGRYQGRILNIHPSLLPEFPGLHTHQRALDAGRTEAGCTVHFVTEGMDEGPVILQTRVPVLDGDTAETLASRVLTVEHKTYAQALRMVASGDVRMGV
ncbi:phosphoribosylglycinamide formyltransferase [Rhizobium sp. DKSPLA3]|uniref:Phosphoribosylglycinamide formyltransferase n=2 Tax=Rhizobium quercicola TaxID=2901226 RepID=A0A9X1T6K9_9HYPH|nr:phosphoribosylglycinamide formyltransferase [Rhizobium quercicola]